MDLSYKPFLKKILFFITQIGENSNQYRKEAKKE